MSPVQMVCGSLHSSLPSDVGSVNPRSPLLCPERACPPPTAREPDAPWREVCGLPSAGCVGWLPPVLVEAALSALSGRVAQT